MDFVAVLHVKNAELTSRLKEEVQYTELEGEREHIAADTEAASC